MKSYNHSIIEISFFKLPKYHGKCDWPPRAGTVIGTGFFVGHLLNGRIDMSFLTTVKMGVVGGMLGALCCSGIQFFFWGRKRYRSGDFGLHILTTLITGLMLPRVLMLIESNYQT